MSHKPRYRYRPSRLRPIRCLECGRMAIPVAARIVRGQARARYLCEHCGHAYACTIQLPAKSTASTGTKYMALEEGMTVLDLGYVGRLDDVIREFWVYLDHERYCSIKGCRVWISKELERLLALEML